MLYPAELRARGVVATPRDRGMARAAARQIVASASAAVLRGAVGDDDLEGSAGAAGVEQHDRAAVGTNELGGNGEAEAGAARPGIALEGAEEIGAHRRGNARPGIGDADRNRTIAAAGADGQA